jgi:predicted RNase H-like HicB family nuclease
MHVASASAVREYKQELVADAVGLAEAGHPEQARRKLVEVCQMAEDGVATVDAYRHLLDLREIEDIPVAFAKIRFAREGARLGEQYDYDDPVEAFRDHYEAAWEYIEEMFIGAQYLGPSGLPVRILDVNRMRLLEGNGAEMSTDTPARVDDPDAAQTITLTRSEDEAWWGARDEETGVASQGRIREDALDNLDEAIAGYHGEWHPPADEELREMGIDPENNESGSIDDSAMFE